MKKPCYLHVLLLIVSALTWLASQEPTLIALFLPTTWRPHAVTLVVGSGLLLGLVHYLWPTTKEILPPPTQASISSKSSMDPGPTNFRLIALPVFLPMLLPVLLLVACAGGPKPILIVTPAQLARQVCPVVQTTLTQLQSPLYSVLLNPKQQADVAAAAKTNAAVCTGAGTITSTDLVTLNNTVLPALTAIVAATPAIPDQPAVLLGLMLAGPLVQNLVDTLIVNQAPASSAPVVSGSGTITVP